MLTLRLTLLLAVAPLLACDGDSGPFPDPSDPGPEIMSISPKQVDMKVGDLVALRITGVSTQLLAVWNSDNPAIASVIAGGFVRGLQAGRAVITATIGTQSASVPVVVQ